MARTLNSPKFTGRGPLPENNPFDYDPPAAPSAPMATEKQVAFAAKLASERGWTVIDARVTYPRAGIDCDLHDFTRREISDLIDQLLKTPKATPAPGAKTTGKKITEDGMYRVPETGEIFKVQRAVHGSGNLYAKKLVIVDPNPPAVVRFDYASGMVYRLRPEWKMTLEEAKAFGALYGTCCVCGRTLTNEESIEAGIGPVCGSRF